MRHSSPIEDPTLNSDYDYLGESLAITNYGRIENVANDASSEGALIFTNFSTSETDISAGGY